MTVKEDTVTSDHDAVVHVPFYYGFPFMNLYSAGASDSFSTGATSASSRWPSKGRM